MPILHDLESRACRLKSSDNMCTSDVVALSELSQTLDWSGRTKADQRHSSTHCLLVSWHFFSELAPVGGLMCRED